MQRQLGIRGDELNKMKLELFEELVKQSHLQKSNNLGKLLFQHILVFNEVY